MRKAHRFQRKEEKRLEEDQPTAPESWCCSPKLGAGDLSATSRSTRYMMGCILQMVISRIGLHHFLFPGHRGHRFKSTPWYHLNLRVQMPFHI